MCSSSATAAVQAGAVAKGRTCCHLSCQASRHVSSRWLWLCALGHGGSFIQHDGGSEEGHAATTNARPQGTPAVSSCHWLEAATMGMATLGKHGRPWQRQEEWCAATAKARPQGRMYVKLSHLRKLRGHVRRGASMHGFLLLESLCVDLCFEAIY